MLIRLLLACRIPLALASLCVSTLCALGQVQTNNPAAVGVVTAPTGDGLALARTKENFSSVSLNDSELHAQPPLLGEKSGNQKFVRELLQLQWRANDPIDLYVIRPRGAKRPPVVLYLYGFPAETDRFKDDGYCERVVKSGAAAVGFVSALTGHRAEHHPPKEWFVAELQQSLATTVHDVQMILNYLDSRGDLDMTRVGMFGQGSGGAIGILAAAADPRIKALDLLDTWGDWPDWLASTALISPQERADYLKPDFLKGLEPLEPVHYLPELKSRTMRFQFVDEYGESRAVVSKLESAIPPGSKIVHYPTSMALRSASGDGRLFEWIAGALNTEATTQVNAANAGSLAVKSK